MVLQSINTTRLDCSVQVWWRICWHAGPRPIIHALLQRLKQKDRGGRDTVIGCSFTLPTHAAAAHHDGRGVHIPQFCYSVQSQRPETGRAKRRAQSPWRPAPNPAADCLPPCCSAFAATAKRTTVKHHHMNMGTRGNRHDGQAGGPKSTPAPCKHRDISRASKLEPRIVTSSTVHCPTRVLRCGRAHQASARGQLLKWNGWNRKGYV